MQCASHSADLLLQLHPPEIPRRPTCGAPCGNSCAAGRVLGSPAAEAGSSGRGGRSLGRRCLGAGGSPGLRRTRLGSGTPSGSARVSCSQDTKQA